MLKKVPLLLVLAATTVVAQDLLDPVVVTATRSARPARTVPYTTSLFDSEFLSEQSPRTLPDALRYVPGVFVQKTTHGHGSPFIRGFTGRQNLLMVDGVRLNNSTFRGGPVQYWNTVDPLSIDHIEVIKSQGSVQYGSDAAGGTVNSFTKSSRFLDEPAGRGFGGGSAFYEYRTNGEGSSIGRLEVDAGIGGTFGVLLGVSAKDYGDIESAAIGRMKNTGYPEQNLDLRFDWAVSPESTVTLATYHTNQDDISRWHRTLDNPGWIDGGRVAAPGRWQENTFDQERSLTFLRYAGSDSQDGAAVTQWNATLSYQTTDESEFQNRFPERLKSNSSVLRQTSIGVDTIGVDLGLESPAGPGSWIYGFDVYHDTVETAGYRSDFMGGSRTENLPLADDSDYTLFGAYSQYAWRPVERFEVTGGVRYSYAEAMLGRFEGGGDETRHWDDVVGSLRGIYTLTDRWSLYGGVSQAFRAPNLDDLSGNLTAKSGGNVAGDPDVNPEHYLTSELGLRGQAETVSGSVAGFYTQVDDLIVPAFTDASMGTSIATNAGDAVVYGVEVEAAWRFLPQWTLSGFAAWQDARTQSAVVLDRPFVDKPNSRQLPLSGSLALRWNDGSGKFWAEARVLGATKEDRITAEDQAADDQRIPTGGTPGYLVASLRAGWQVNSHLDLTCSLENVSDEDYRIHGSGQNESGLGGVVSVKMKW